MNNNDFGVASSSSTAYSRDEMPKLVMACKNINLHMARLQDMGTGMAAERPMPHMSERIPLNTSWDHVVLEVSGDRVVDLKSAFKQPKYSQLPTYSFEPGSLQGGEAPGAFSAYIKARLASGVAAAKEEASASCCPCLPCLGEPEDEHASEAAATSAAAAAASEQASSDCLPCLPCNLL